MSGKSRFTSTPRHIRLEATQRLKNILHQFYTFVAVRVIVFGTSESFMERKKVCRVHRYFRRGAISLLDL